MTDRIKGFLVTLESNIREDDAEAILNALQMVKLVHSVVPYVSGMEDYMCERRGRTDALFEVANSITGLLNLEKKEA